MTNEKPFKTIDEQIDILNKRGLSTNENSKISLKQFGYYSIVNGYKWLFLSRNTNGKIVKPEQFIKNSTFDDIRKLYDFDKEFRSILYKALLEYESNLRAKISYTFCEHHPEESAYLNSSNYNEKINVDSSIKKLKKVIRKYNKKSEDNAIKHYTNHYGQVPLWVLVNFLTFGDINYFYNNIEEQVRIDISKKFSEKYKLNYSKSVKIQSTSIDSINHMVNDFRNAVAHGDVTYYMHLIKGPSFKSIKKDLSLNELKVSSQRGIFELVIALKLVLNSECFYELKSNLYKLFDDYENNFYSVSFDTILHDMNFPQNYKDFI